jgi:hypothetical protein
MNDYVLLLKSRLHLPNVELLSVQLAAIFVAAEYKFSVSFLVSFIALTIIRWAYFYGSTVIREADGTTDQVWHCWMVHSIGPFVLTKLVVEFSIVIGGMSMLTAAMYSLLLVISALYFGDLIAGFTHFVGDVTKEYHFMYHHINPVYIVNKSYVHHTAHSYLIALPFFGISCWLNIEYPGTVWWMRLMMLIAVQGNETHHYAHCHSKEVGSIVAWLQKYYLFIRRDLHLTGHHRYPYNKDFCTVNGWANNLLNRVAVPFSECAWVKRRYPELSKEQMPTKDNYEPERSQLGF